MIAGLLRIVSGWRTSAVTTVVAASPASWARPWVSTIGSLSTYATRALGLSSWAISWVLRAVGRPEPRSRNWSMPWSCRYLTARSSTWRLSMALAAACGNAAITSAATARSQGKLSLPPRIAS